MSYFLSNLILALIWAAIGESFSLSALISGLVLGYLALWLLQPVIGPSKYFGKIPGIASFGALYLWKLTQANLRVAFDVVTPRHYMKPGIIAVPLDATTDLEIALLSSLVTMTPGTLSMDVSPDRKRLYIHAMYAEDPEALKREIKEDFEKRVLEVLR